MRLLLISTPFTGHISPTFNMAKSLVDMGHDVCYITTPQWEETVHIVGAQLIAYEENNKLSVMLSEAYNLARTVGNQYDGIIYDELFFLGRVLGEAVDKPAIRFFPCAAIDRQIMDQMLSGSGFMGIFRTQFIRKRWTKEICKPLALDITDWTDEVVNNPPDCNIVFVPEWFQPRLEDFPKENYCFAGPSVYNDSDEELHHSITCGEQPVVYISLGTIDNKQLKFYKKCLQVFDGKDARFVLSVGNKIHIEKLGAIPPNCTVYPHAPQKKILEYARLFVTHGGMNSVNEAMLNRVPMLVLPVSNDQPINAQRIAELGIGKTIDIKGLDGTLLWNIISEMLCDEVLYTRVSEIQEKLSNTGGETAAKAVVTHIRGN